MRKLIIGCGYLGERVAAQWLQAGAQVSVLTRSQQRAEQLAGLGFDPLVGDLTEPDSLPQFPPCTTILYAVGYDRSSNKSIQEVYVEGLQNFLQRIPEVTGKLIYISSSGVFGQNDGSWVNENSPCNPCRPGGIACLAAEALLASHPLADRTTILRMAGIYGPDRLPRRTTIEAGEPLAADQHGYLNLIHVFDAVQVILAAEACETLSPLLLVSDGQPVLRSAYFQEMARLLQAPDPLFSAADPQSPGAQRASTNKRISNQQLLEELNISFRYPSFREGLAALLGSPIDADPENFADGRTTAT